VVFPSPPYVGRSSDPFQEEIPHQTSGSSKRTFKLDHQDYPVLLGVIPDFVFVCVVEDSEFAQFPGELLGADADLARFPVVGDDEAQMIVDDALGYATMRDDTAIWGKDREECCDDAGNFIENVIGGGWTF
jgi:hypothetical protein